MCERREEGRYDCVIQFCGVFFKKCGMDFFEGMDGWIKGMWNGMLI